MAARLTCCDGGLWLWESQIDRNAGELILCDLVGYWENITHFNIWLGLEIKMQAKCPLCFGGNSGCGKCGGTGYVEVTITTGKMYTRHCTVCGDDNGGIIIGPDGYSKEKLRTPPRDCVECGGAAEWLLVGVNDRD